MIKIVEFNFLQEVLRVSRLDGNYSGAKHACVKLGFPEIPPSDGKVFFTLSEAENIAALFRTHGLPRSADILLEWVRQDFRSRSLPPEVVMSELQRSIERELRANVFLHVEENRRQYLEGAELFGESVNVAFASAAYDIEEAGKCYALSRYTACVMHLMRVLEVGLDSLKNLTGITSYSPTWKVAIDQVLKAVSVTPEKVKTPEERERDAFIREAAHFLTVVKDAIRNPVMHKVARTYTDETASEVFSAVRAFMRHLATRLSEASA